jgi:hypothetical protein
MRSSVTAGDLETLRAAIGGGVVPFALALGDESRLVAGTLMWPWEHSHRVLHEWRSWSGAAGGEVTSVARIVRVPWLPGVAPALRGRGFVAVDVALLGDPSAASRRLAALRRLGPELDTVAIVSRSELLARCPAPGGGASAIGAHVLLRELPVAALDAFLAAAGPNSRSELVAAELRHLGDGEYAVAGIGVAGDVEQAQRIRIGLARLERRLAPWVAG